MTIDKNFLSELKNYSKQRRSRLIVIQAVYMYKFSDNEDPPELILDSLLNLYENLDQKFKENINSDLISTIYSYILENEENIAIEIKKYLTNIKSFEDLSINIIAILNCAIAEMITNPDVDLPIIINEYTDLCKDFEKTEKSKFINAILDKIAKNLSL